MSTTPYTTLQDIIEEAGLVTKVRGERASGIVDGSNATFGTAKSPLVDSDYDDKVTSADIRVYVDETLLSAAGISEIDAEFGTVTLVNAPAENSTVSIDYNYAAIGLRFVSAVRDEAQERIDTRMKKVDSSAPYTTTPIPATVAGITRHFAAAWLLIRDYGFNQDIEGTSKDGYKRLETAEEMLEAYAAAGGATGSDGNGSVGNLDSLEVASDGNLFPEPKVW